MDSLSLFKGILYRMKIQVMLLSMVWVALLLGENRPSVVGELDGGKMLKS